MIFDHQIEKSKHLLLWRVDHQVLTLGHIELEQELLFYALNLGNVIHLVAKLANVNFLYRNRFQGWAWETHTPVVRVLRTLSVASDLLLVWRHGCKLLIRLLLDGRCRLLVGLDVTIFLRRSFFDGGCKWVFYEWVWSHLHWQKVLAVCRLFSITRTRLRNVLVIGLCVNVWHCGHLTIFNAGIIVLATICSLWVSFANRCFDNEVARDWLGLGNRACSSQEYVWFLHWSLGNIFTRLERHRTTFCLERIIALLLNWQGNCVVVRTLWNRLIIVHLLLERFFKGS